MWAAALWTSFHSSTDPPSPPPPPNNLQEKSESFAAPSNQVTILLKHTLSIIGCI